MRILLNRDCRRGENAETVALTPNDSEKRQPAPFEAMS